MYASEARGGTSRPEHAASMWRGIGMIRFLLEPFLEDGHRFVHFAQRAVSKSQQSPASGCFGLNVMTLKKQTAASLVRFWVFRRMPRFV